jgi:hypothetical protein
MALSLINSDIFQLPTSGPTTEVWLHLGTAHDGLKEYVCLTNTRNNKCYVEKWSGTQLVAIDDDNEFEDVARFFEMRGLTDMKRVANYLGKRKADALAKGK